MKQILLVLLTLLLLWVQAPLWANGAVVSSAGLIEQAFRQQQSNLQIEDEGTVIKLLPDDIRGSRHQRFLIRLTSGQTLLIAHNIDLAGKVENLKVGDTIAFSGEYEWSKKGGTLHWTHHDPQQRHVGGWLKHDNRIYQ